MMEHERVFCSCFFFTMMEHESTVEPVLLKGIDIPASGITPLTVLKTLRGAKVYAVVVHLFQNPTKERTFSCPGD